MNKNTIIAVLAVLVISGIGAYALNIGTRNNLVSRVMQPSDMHRMSDGSMMNNRGEMSSMNGMMVENEREFIEEMIPHHQEAIDTAREVLARGGTTPEIRTLAQNIITAQEQEIYSMKVWYESWYGIPYQSTAEYTPMMRELSSLSGKVLDRTFLEDMVMHHMGAIMMAQSVQPYIEHQEIDDLSKAIVSTQSEEIQLMRQMLKDL